MAGSPLIGQPLDMLSRVAIVWKVVEGPSLSTTSTGQVVVRISPARGALRFLCFYGPLIVWILGAKVIRRITEGDNTQVWVLHLGSSEIFLGNEPFTGDCDLVGDAELLRKLLPLLQDFSMGKRRRPAGGLLSLVEPSASAP